MIIGINLKKNIIIYGTGVSSLDVITMLTGKNNKIYHIPEHFCFLFPDRLIKNY